MNIAIIGCGYIGMEAAALWSKKGHHVTATTRHAERLADLAKVAQKTLILKNGDEEELALLIETNDVLVVTIAADSVDQYENTYLHMAQQFRHLALQMELPRHLLYTSSSSVYGDHNGRWVDESGPLLAESEQGKVLIAAENLYLSLSELDWKVCILRLAEIYGPGREISQRVKNLQGHVLPGSGDQYTNMVHKADIVGALDYSLRHQLEGVYNVVDDEHPSRRELYEQVIKEYSLSSFTWDSSLVGMHPGNKRVSNHKIKAAGYSFIHPSREIA
ncbi:MAG: SDR family oxidoreductase [Chlamydiales bacterium]|nr:SDR family oxidoreductase [Chlamydiales bacterium]